MDIYGLQPCLVWRSTSYLASYVIRQHIFLLYALCPHPLSWNKTSHKGLYEAMPGPNKNSVNVSFHGYLRQMEYLALEKVLFYLLNPLTLNRIYN